MSEPLYIDESVAETERKQPQPFTTWKPSQFLEYTVDPSSYLLGEGIIEKGEWTSLVGVGGLGKTRLALWYVICQAIGREWCGLKVGAQPQVALFLSTENGLRRWKTDLERMMGTLSESERALVEAYVRILALTADEEGDLNLSDDANTLRLRATLATVQPGIVVFDPFADMIAGDENKTADVVASLRTLRNILRSSAPSSAVIIIHHARTGASNVAQAGDNYSSGNFGRGSKALYSRVRAELQLAPADRDDPNRLVLACGKANNSERFRPRGLVFDPESFRYEVDPDFDLEAWRDDVAGKRKDPAVTIEAVVEAVRAAYTVGNDVSTAAIVDPIRHETGASAKTVQRRLKDAAELHYLKAGSKRGTWRLGSKPLKRT